MFFSIWYQFWTFMNPTFNIHFYWGVCLLVWSLSPHFNSPFSPPDHLYFLPHSFFSQSNSVNLCVFLGCREHLGNRVLPRSVSLLLSTLFSSCSHLSPSSLSSSSCNSVNLSGYPSLWRTHSPLTYKFYYQCCMDGEVLRLLEE